MPYTSGGDKRGGAGTTISDRVSIIATRAEPPPAVELIRDIGAALQVLRRELREIRPHDEEGRPGGIVRLDPALPVVVMPDIHGRVNLLERVLSAEFPQYGIDAPVLRALQEGRVSLLMVGDYVHGEGRVRQRWASAYEEFLGRYRYHRAMDEEMNESLGSLQIVAMLKARFPEHVHCLKGNHENISNEEGHGNHSFYKFADEGAMVAAYIDRFYPGEALREIYQFEKELPLLAVGSRFLVSHAEPLRSYTAEEIIRYRDNPPVVEGLTWTDNGMAESGAVAGMLRSFLPDHEGNETVYLGGHRPVADRYALRCDGRFVQFHNPDRNLVAVLALDRRFDPEHDILEI